MQNMMAKHFFTLHIFAITVALFIGAWTPGWSENIIPSISSLKRSNPELKSIREDVRTALFVIKSGRSAEQVPQLRFFKYRVKQEDTFWTILAKTSLDMDTLITANNLATPRDIANGMTIYIPNMRGIIYKKKSNESLDDISRKFKGTPEVLKIVNKMDNKAKPVIFIPCGKLSSLERSLFLGTAFASPVNSGRKTSGFGVRKDPIQHDKRFHSGIDIACPIGTRVNSARNGRVIFSGYSGGYGKLVIVKHSRNYCTYYGHLNKILVKKGDTVSTGQKIAISGNTGRTTGPHLHFEVRKYEKPIDPGLLLNM